MGREEEESGVRGDGGVFGKEAGSERVPKKSIDGATCEGRLFPCVFLGFPVPSFCLGRMFTSCAVTHF